MRRLSAGLFVVLCLISSHALAATITVTNTNDNGPGSLRQALVGASPGDSVNFSLTFPATIDLTSGDLQIFGDVAIVGPGPDKLTVRRSTAAATPAFRVFTIAPGFAQHVTISGMTISNGLAGEGGAISSSADLTVDNVVLTGNSADATSGSGALLGGGAVAVLSGQLTVRNSTIDSNTSAFVGGGIVAATLFPVSISISGSTISNNTANYGGGLFLGYNSVTAEIRNATISGNQASIDGGQVFVHGVINGPVVKFTAATLVGSGPDAVTVWGAGAVPGVEFRNTILVGLTPTVRMYGVTGVVSNGFNLATDAPGFLTGPGDQNNVDPLLAPLVNYGGSTSTHRLQAGSPAIDAGSCADAANAAILSDQRGVTRPQGAACDIGAFEVQVDALANLDAAVSTRATQASVDTVQNGVNSLQTGVSSRASQVSVDAITGIVNGKLDAAISSRATQTSVEAVQNNLGSVESGLGTVQSNLGTVQTSLGSVQSGLGAVQTNLGAVATQTSVNQLGSSISSIYTGMGTLSTQVSGVATQVTGLSSALDAQVSTRASQASVDALAGQIGGGMPLRPFIELQLLVGARLSSLYLPAAYGGILETVRDLVASTITANTRAGINANTAPALLASGNAAFAAGNYKLAYDTYAKAYQACALGR